MAKGLRLVERLGRAKKEKDGWGLGYADEAGDEPCNSADKQNLESDLV
ncbi:MAG: hypothetical protein ABIB41_10690 [Nitrospirota bacterium]